MIISINQNYSLAFLKIDSSNLGLIFVVTKGRFTGSMKIKKHEIARSKSMFWINRGPSES